MSVTATEFKTNLSKYLLMAARQDILITRNGKVIAKLTSPYKDKLKTLDDLFGSVPDTMTLADTQEERLGNI